MLLSAFVCSIFSANATSHKQTAHEQTAHQQTKPSRQKVADELFKDLPFKVQQSQHLRFVKRTANSLILKDNGPYDRNKSVVPLMVLSSSESEQEIVDMIEFSKQQLHHSQSLSEVTIEQENTTTVAGIRAYHIIARAIDLKTSTSVMVFQTIAFQPNRYLLIQGLAAQTQAKQFTPQFNQIVDSVSFKKVGS